MLEHVYWLGGGSGAGKSTIARRLADKHGLRLYGTDEAMADHGVRAVPEDCPYLAAFKSLSMDERWVNRSPQAMLDTFHWFQGECFGLIVEDLLALPSDRGIIVEGFRLLPHLVEPLLGRRDQAVWLLPSPAFRRAAFESRNGLWSVAGRTSNPEQALANLLERDRLFTESLQTEAKEAGLPAIAVDIGMSEGVLENHVAWQFGLS